MFKVTEDIIYVGVNDHEVDLFEGQYDEMCIRDSRRCIFYADTEAEQKVIPEGEEYKGLDVYKRQEYNAPVELGKSEVIHEGQDVVILSVGSIMEECEKAVQHLQEKGYNPGLVNVRFIRPMDEDLLRELAAKYQMCIRDRELSFPVKGRKIKW